MKSQLTGEDPDAGKEWGQEEKGMCWLDDIINSMDMNLSKLWEMMKYRETWRAAVFAKSCKESDMIGWLNNSTETEPGDTHMEKFL